MGCLEGRALRPNVEPSRSKPNNETATATRASTTPGFLGWFARQDQTKGSAGGQLRDSYFNAAKKTDVVLPIPAQASARPPITRRGDAVKREAEIAAERALSVGSSGSLRPFASGIAPACSCGSTASCQCEHRDGEGPLPRQPSGGARERPMSYVPVTGPGVPIEERTQRGTERRLLSAVADALVSRSDDPNPVAQRSDHGSGSLNAERPVVQSPPPLFSIFVCDGYPVRGEKANRRVVASQTGLAATARPLRRYCSAVAVDSGRVRRSAESRLSPAPVRGE
jgi:hypothetical protein